MRVIEGQATLMARTTHDISVDTVHDELALPNPFAEAILFFRGDAKGEEAPIRVIQGPKTQLGYTDNVQVDSQHDEVFTAQSRTASILVFQREAQGDVEPIRVIHGPKTRLNRPRNVAVDPVNDLLVVINGDPAEGVLIFNRTDGGDVAPRAIIGGPKTGLSKGLPAKVRLYPPGKKIFVTIAGRPTREGMMGGSISIWKYDDNGNVPPWAILKASAITKLTSSFGGVALNPEARELMVVDNEHPAALLVYRLPEVFRSVTPSPKGEAPISSLR